MRFPAIAAVIFCAAFCVAWDNPCYKMPVKPITIPKQGRSQITLEASRVQLVQGSTIVYDLGKETIVIKVDSLISRQFLKEVRGGACSARDVVTLEPDKDSPFAVRYKASVPFSH